MSSVLLRVFGQERERHVRAILWGREKATDPFVLWVAAPTYPLLKDLIPQAFCSFNHISVGLKNGHGGLCMCARGSLSLQQPPQLC